MLNIEPANLILSIAADIEHIVEKCTKIVGEDIVKENIKDLEIQLKDYDMLYDIDNEHPELFTTLEKLYHDLKIVSDLEKNIHGIGIEEITSCEGLQIIESGGKEGKFIYKEKNWWIGIDNSDGNRWAAQCENKQNLILWINDVISYGELCELGGC